jgi:hypothetical protein
VGLAATGGLAGTRGLAGGLGAGLVALALAGGALGGGFGFALAAGLGLAATFAGAAFLEDFDGALAAGLGLGRAVAALLAAPPRFAFAMVVPLAATSFLLLSIVREVADQDDLTHARSTHHPDLVRAADPGMRVEDASAVQALGGKLLIVHIVTEGAQVV